MEQHKRKEPDSGESTALDEGNLNGHKDKVARFNDENSEDEVQDNTSVQDSATDEDCEPLIIEDERDASAIADGHELAKKANTEDFMQWLIAPLPVSDFMEQIWDNHPLYISRTNHPKYYDGFHSIEDVKELLRQGKLCYGEGVDVTKYIDGKRHSFNYNKEPKSLQEKEIADMKVVWSRFENDGATIRVHHPQRWLDPLHNMLSACERFWQWGTGCNVYLTPKGSQGFPPHFDDIDAFILQIEGSKRWRVYKPHPGEGLQRFPPNTSIHGFKQGEHGEPILEVETSPGDLLYLPRGVVHEAESCPDTHSLHVTLSTNQLKTWADLFEIALPMALEEAAVTMKLLRRSLPADFMRHTGVVHSESNHPSRLNFVNMGRQLLQQVISNLSIDEAVDQMARRFTAERLSPISSPKRSLSSGSDSAPTLSQTSLIGVSFPENSRLIIEEDQAVLYHMMDNERTLHMLGGGNAEGKESKLSFPMSYAPALEVFCVSSADKSIKISSLPLPPDHRLKLVSELLEAGIVERRSS